MYSLVLMVAMSATPDVPQSFLCPVSPSNYGSTFWSKHCFYDCCMPARYEAGVMTICCPGSASWSGSSC